MRKAKRVCGKRQYNNKRRGGRAKRKLLSRVRGSKIGRGARRSSRRTREGEQEEEAAQPLIVASFVVVAALRKTEKEIAKKRANNKIKQMELLTS